jgi:hypothetical protein
VSADLLALHRILASPPSLLAEALPPRHAAWQALGSCGGAAEGSGSNGGGGGGNLGSCGGAMAGRLVSATPPGPPPLQPLALRRRKPTGVRFALACDGVIEPATPGQSSAPAAAEVAIAAADSTAVADPAAAPPDTSPEEDGLAAKLASLRAQLAASLTLEPAARVSPAASPPPAPTAKHADEAASRVGSSSSSSISSISGSSSNGSNGGNRRGQEANNGAEVETDDDDDDDDGNPPKPSPAPAFGMLPLRDAAAERVALTAAAARLYDWLAQQPTPLAEDEVLLKRLTLGASGAATEAAKAGAATSNCSSGSGSRIDVGGRRRRRSSGISGGEGQGGLQGAEGAPAATAPAARVDNDRALNALRYRVTRKRAVARQLAHVAALKRELNRCCLANGAADGKHDAAAALRALGLPPPPAPRLESFPAALRPHVAALREAYLPRSGAPNNNEAETEEKTPLNGPSAAAGASAVAAAAAAAAAAAEARVGCRIGCRVELHSLVAKPELNGQHGVVSAAAPADGRWAVLLDGAAKPMALKPKNLRVVQVQYFNH